jgi:gamma-glutamylputrescine oxidase
VPKDSQLIIIGAGLMGISIAYWMEQFTDLDILIYEKKEIAFGASGRNAGFITAGSAYHLNLLLEKYDEQRVKDIWSFCTENIAAKEQLLKELKVNFEQNGSLTFGDDDILEKAYNFCQKYKFRAQFKNTNLGRGLKFTNELTLNSKDLLNAMVKSLKRTKIIFKSAKPEDFPEQTVFLATNFLEDFSNEVCGDFKKQVRPVRAQIQRNTFMEDITLPAENLYFPKNRIYMRREKNTLLIGGLRGLDPTTEETSILRDNPIIQNSLTDYCIKNFGKISSSERWCGIMSFSTDELPLYRVQGSVHFIGGFSGHGNGFAFLAAKRWVLNRYKNENNIILP